MKKIMATIIITSLLAVLFTPIIKSSFSDNDSSTLLCEDENIEYTNPRPAGVIDSLNM